MEWIEVTSAMTPAELRKITARPDETFAGVDEIVLGIINEVREGGDKALYELTEKFDRCRLDSLAVTPEEVNLAVELVGPDFLDVLEEATANIRAYHEEQKEETWTKEFRPGVILGSKITPIERIGVYVPGGQAAYPSTVLMDVIPAQVAGVPSIAMVTPPGADGTVNPYILAAAKVLGITEIYKVGGAQSIAALAYGTETIEPVYKIVGPGNAYVAAAKRQVFGKVGIDMIAGPSEVGIIADEGVNPQWVAADLLAQAEHDQRAAVYLVTPYRNIAEAIAEEVYTQIEAAPRKAIMKASVDDWMRIFIVPNLDVAFDVMNGLAPEHLELALQNARDYLPKVRNAGAIFLGHYTPEPIGDYFAGPNHTLPTSGTATFSSPLGVYDFIKHSSILEYDKAALLKVAKKVEAFAHAEGLFGHEASVRRRRDAE